MAGWPRVAALSVAVHSGALYVAGRPAATHSTTPEAVVMAEWPRVVASSAVVVAVHPGAVYAASQSALTHSTTPEAAVEAD
jgi:hypothetical protein